MATAKTVTATILGSTGQPYPFGLAIATLSQAGTYNGGAINPVPQEARSDANGVVTLSLPSNADITPAGTYYTLELIAGASQSIETIEVPNVKASYDVVADALVVTPPTASPTSDHVASMTVDGALRVTNGPITVPAGSVPLSAVNGTNGTINAVSFGGLTGATAGGRFVGYTAYGAPTSGTFAIGDVVISKASGSVFVCTAAGTPGTWLVKDGQFNVLDYGAKGDGTTNDTVAIRAAITAATTNGGIVYLPVGTYLVSGSLVIPNQVTLRGAGPSATTIKLANASNVDVVSVTAANSQYVQLRDFTIDGNSANNTSGWGINCASGNITNVIDNVTVLNCASGGVTFPTGGDRVKIDRIYCNNNGGPGLKLVSCTRFHLGLIASERSDDPVAAASCVFTKCDDFHIETLTVEQTTGSGKKGAVFDSCIGVQVDTVWTYGGTGAAQTSAVEWNSTTTPGRAADFRVQNIQTSNYTNLVNDVVNAITVTSAVFGSGVTYYSDLGHELPPAGGLYNGGANSPIIGTATGAGTIYFRPNGHSSGVSQMTLNSAGVLSVPGDLEAGVHVYPGAEAGGVQTSGGVIHSTGIPSNTNGNNNDWCISDNGHLYFKSAGAWVQKI